MVITVKLFALYKELVGSEQLSLEVEPGSTAGEAVALLKRRYPVLARQRHSPLAACNLRHVGASHELKPGDELALFPPVSGG